MEAVYRVTFLYLFLMLGFRLMGKRELGQLSQFELVTLMLIPEIVSEALNRSDASITSALVGVCTLLTLVTATSLLVHVSPKAAAAFEGRPAVLVRHGVMLVDTMNRERISPDELFSEMHQAGIEHLADVKWAILEPEGRMAFIPASSAVTPPVSPIPGPSAAGL